MTTPSDDFVALSDLVHSHAQRQGPALAACDATECLTWAGFDAQVDAVASWLQAQGVGKGAPVAVCAVSSVHYAVVFVGILRAGGVVVPLSPSVTPEVMGSMLRDSQARMVLVDEGTQALVKEAAAALNVEANATAGGPLSPAPQRLTVLPMGTAFAGPSAPRQPEPCAVHPADPFNIIYSSGTTGTPKGIVQPHGMRWMHIKRGAAYAYGPDSRTLLSTPLYSNTTLVAFMPTLGHGGCLHLMPKFDALQWLQTAQDQRITHTMLVPVQIQRLLDHPRFDEFDLSSLTHTFSTSAPLSAALKRQWMDRTGSGLVEFYGMTEGGGTCILEAHLHPEKLHTVGRPSAGHDIRLIDEEGRELPPGSTGEVVGRSPAMMSGYHGQPEKTREAEWFDAQGLRFIRTGDVGRFDEDGFLTLMDRRKDMLISGGFNLYPSDLEALLRQHPAVADVAVVGVASRRWGETPVAWVVPRPGAASEESLLEWFNARCGKMQRLAGLAFVDELPRNAIGKILKRELRELWKKPVA